DGAQDLGLRWKLREHVVLAAPQQERRHPTLKLAAAVRVALPFDRHAEEARELPLRPEKPRQQEVEQAPRLAEVVLERSARKAKAMTRVQRSRRAGGLRPRVLHVLRLVEHDEM